MDPSPADRTLRLSRLPIRRALAMLALAAAMSALGVEPARAEVPARLCSRVGTDDTLRNAPASLAPAINAVFGTRMSPAEAARSTFYRCIRGRVLVCTIGGTCHAARRTSVGLFPARTVLPRQPERGLHPHGGDGARHDF